MRPADFIAVLALLPAFVAPAAAGQDQRQQVQNWFDQAWAEAQRFPDLAGYSLSWTTEQYSVLSADDVSQLQHEVKLHPEHPDHHVVVDIQRARGGPIAVHSCTLWSDGGGQWRYNADSPQIPGTYFDKALTKQVAWMLTPNVLNVFDPSRESPPGRDIRDEERVFLPDIGMLLNGGLTYGWLGSLQPGEVHGTQSSWSVEATLRGESGGDLIFALEYSGHWDVEHSRGFIDRMRITRTAATTGPGETTVFRGWRLDPLMNRWIATSADVYTPSGSRERSIRFRSAGAVSPEALRAVLTVPESGRDDPVRGAVRITQTNDWRSGTLTFATTGGVMTKPLPGSLTQSQRDRWQVLGWVLGASLVAGLIGLSLRKHLARA